LICLQLKAALDILQSGLSFSNQRVWLMQKFIFFKELCPNKSLQGTGGNVGKNEGVVNK